MEHPNMLKNQVLKFEEEKKEMACWVNISQNFGENSCMGFGCETSTKFKIQKFSVLQWHQLLPDTHKNLIGSRSSWDKHILKNLVKIHGWVLGCGIRTGFMPPTAAFIGWG